MSMVRGRVISFDRIKGYGFVAPDIGGEDVFIHVNDLYSEKDLLATGSIVEFRLDEGERGPKASAVTVLQLASVDAPHAAYAVHGVRAAQAAPSGADVPAERTGMSVDEETVEVLTANEYMHEVTEALLRVEPELTSRQIVEIRKRLMRIAQEHDWTVG